MSDKIKCPEGWYPLPSFTWTFTYEELEEMRQQRLKAIEELNRKAREYGGVWG